MARYINVDSALQAHPEFLNEQIDDHDKAIYAKGWNACNSAFYGAIKELPTVSTDEVLGIGKWIVKQTATGKDYTVCSACNTDFKSENEKGTLSSLDMRGMPYCPYCGAKMEVSE